MSALDRQEGGYWFWLGSDGEIEDMADEQAELNFGGDGGGGC